MKQPVNNSVNSRLKERAQALIRMQYLPLRTAYAQVVRTKADEAFLEAWYRYGRSARNQPETRQTLRMAPELLSPLGQMVQLTLALATLGKRRLRPLSG